MDVTLSEQDAHKIAGIISSQVVEQLKTLGFTPQVQSEQAEQATAPAKFNQRR
jgi:hypothetical protein